VFATALKQRLKHFVTQRILRTETFKYALATETLQSESHAASAVAVVCRLREDCPLGALDDELFLPLDVLQLSLVQARGEIDMDNVRAFADKIRIYGPGSLIDVGANCGLFTSQMMKNWPDLIHGAICIEPHPTNFSCLERNLARATNVRKFKIALGRNSGLFPFYEDRINAGNYSLLKDSVASTNVRETLTEVKQVSEFFSDAQLEPGLLYWKSDTQGYDQLIVSLTPDEVWRRVNVALIELRPIQDVQDVIESFIDKIRPFELEILGAGRTTIEGVRQFLGTGVGSQEELLAWRKSGEE
jgi:FkbM family methyltransferase